MENKIYIDAEKVLDKYPPIIEIGFEHPLINKREEKIICELRKIYKKCFIFIRYCNGEFIKVHSIFKSEQDYIKTERLIKKLYVIV